MTKETKSTRRARCYAEWQKSLEILAEKLTDRLRQIEDEPERSEPEAVLKHGDYGFDENKISRLRLMNYDEKQMEAGENCCDLPFKELRLKTKLGNIFNDLKMLSVDVTEFEVPTRQEEAEIEGSWSNISTVFHIKQDTDIVAIDEDDLLSLANLLRQVYATKQRNRKSKDV